MLTTMSPYQIVIRLLLNSFFDVCFRLMNGFSMNG